MNTMHIFSSIEFLKKPANIDTRPTYINKNNAYTAEIEKHRHAEQVNKQCGVVLSVLCWINGEPFDYFVLFFLVSIHSN